MKRIITTAAMAVSLFLVGVVALPTVPAVAHGGCSRDASPIVKLSVPEHLESTATVSCGEVHYQVTVFGTIEKKVGTEWRLFGSTYRADCTGGVRSCSVRVSSQACSTFIQDPNKFRVQVDSIARRTANSGYSHINTSFKAQATLICS